MVISWERPQLLTTRSFSCINGTIKFAFCFHYLLIINFLAIVYVSISQYGSFIMLYHTPKCFIYYTIFTINDVSYSEIICIKLFIIFVGYNFLILLCFYACFQYFIINTASKKKFRLVFQNKSSNINLS